MGQHLLVRLWLHGDGLGVARYHGMALGSPEWPPSPARVFQALVAGAACPGEGLPPATALALAWLERRPAPIIVAPRRSLGQAIHLYVPNNDADVLADPKDVSGVRTRKRVQPSLFSADEPILYAWAVDDVPLALDVANVALGVYQLGRGIDMAWAVADIVGDAALEHVLEAHPGAVYRPEVGGGGSPSLACPVPGSLVSLELRFRAAAVKLIGDGHGRVRFTNPPKPVFATVAYAPARGHRVFEIRDRKEDRPWPWPLTSVTGLVERVRDAAAARLRRAMPDLEGQIEACLVGRKRDGRDAVPAGERIRIIPLPSIGSSFADRAIRRFAVEIPSAAPLHARDLEWAFTSLEEYDAETGEAGRWVALRATDETMLGHYRGPARRFRSVTPVALPESAHRRRIDPARRRDDVKPARERLDEEHRAVLAVRDALRHARVRSRATRIHVQREPFEAKGARAEAFATRTRFAKERLWHVEVELAEPVEGPLVLGDGRFLGLGVCAPVPDSRDVWAFAVASELAGAWTPHELARHLRRAVMARAQAALGRTTPLPTFFDGHGEDRQPARREEASHLAFAVDPGSRRLLVVAPHALERRAPRPNERAYLDVLEQALAGFVELVAGRGGRLVLDRSPWYPEDDALAAPACTWESVTPYVVTRHAKRVDAREAVAADVLVECRRAGLPQPKVEVREARGQPGLGLTGRLRLHFDVAVGGPILLGRDRHLGGGLFGASRERRDGTQAPAR